MKKTNFLNSSLFILGFICLLLFSNCKKNLFGESSTIPDIATDTILDPNALTTFTSDYAYNLNVVYFVPKDATPYADYETRLSEILLEGQAFYKKWMAYNGFGNKTFGLFLNATKKKVKITTITGQLNKADYPYEGGGGKAATEIQAYFAAHPAEKSGLYTLVIIPANELSANGSPLNTPFYGLSPYCFATDFPKFKQSNYLNKPSLPPGSDGDIAAYYVGGLFHELGHGLGLPHNFEKKSERADPNLGRGLMGIGNGTYGRTPTFITAFDCAMLNNNQIFNKESRSEYNVVPTDAAVQQLTASFSNGKIILSGNISSSKPVNAVLVQHDNKNPDFYDAEGQAWYTPVINGNSFYVEMPISELDDINTNYTLRIILAHTNGAITRHTFDYSITNGVPFFTFNAQPISKANWSIAAGSGEPYPGSNPYSYLIDGDITTSWYEDVVQHPNHFFVINMGQTNTITGIAVNVFTGQTGCMSKFNFLVSNDNVNWTSAGTFDIANIDSTQKFMLSSPVTARYFKVNALSSTYNVGFTCLYEIGVF
jgi:hypothetical protein